MYRYSGIILIATITQNNAAALLLLQHKADVDTVDEWSLTPLFYVQSKENIQVGFTLIEAKAELGKIAAEATHLLLCGMAGGE